MMHPEISEQTILAQALLEKEPRVTVLSFDPGGDSDYAALALLTYAQQDRVDTRRYLCQRVLRVPHGTDYPEIEDLVVSAYVDVVRQRDRTHQQRWGPVRASKRPPLGAVYVLVERNGVGRGMIGALRRRGVPVTSIWTSGGEGWAHEPAAFSIALSEIVRTLLRVWGWRRLLFAQFSEAELALLEGECRDYEHRVTQAGHSTYRARSGSHDDVLRALAQGVAWCEHGHLPVRASKVTGV
jgi:hypothetical protein